MQNIITYSPHYNVKINKIFNELEHISSARMARFLKAYINAVDTITVYVNRYESKKTWLSNIYCRFKFS